MKKIITSIVISLSLVLFGVTNAYAHVTVKPAEVVIGQRLNFVVSVPTEEATPTVAVRLVIPEGLVSVRPNVKPGWTIQLKKSGSGETERVTEIVWAGGRIPADQRDEFVFSAQAPKVEGNLVWRAYQTYGDGDVVAWDMDPKVVEEYTKKNTPAPGIEDDHNAPRPYSQTKVVNDLAMATAKPSSGVVAGGASNNNSGGFMLSLVAIVLSIASIGMQIAKKR